MKNTYICANGKIHLNGKEMNDDVRIAMPHRYKKDVTLALFRNHLHRAPLPQHLMEDTDKLMDAFACISHFLFRLDVSFQYVNQVAYNKTYTQAYLFNTTSETEVKSYIEVKAQDETREYIKGIEFDPYTPKRSVLSRSNSQDLNNKVIVDEQAGVSINEARSCSLFLLLAELYSARWLQQEEYHSHIIVDGVNFELPDVYLM